MAGPDNPGAMKELQLTRPVVSKMGDECLEDSV